MIRWRFLHSRLWRGTIWLQWRWGGVGFRHRTPPDPLIGVENWAGGFGFGGFSIERWPS